MKRLQTILLTATAMVALTACDPASEEFRTVEEINTLQDIGIESRARDRPGDGDIQLFDGASTTDPDCLIADIAGPIFYDGPVSTGNVQWELSESENEIFDRSGQLVCTVNASGRDQFELRDAVTDQVLATLWKRYVFDGAVSTIRPHERWAHVAVSFNRTHLMEGTRRNGTEILTATENIEQATPYRRLVIAAFAQGLCGSSGLPEITGAGSLESSLFASDN